ncbi:MAG TPA: YqhA family protein, partial [Pyrinomonadaceae bacterium]|nr:YqhA family protein [Pyrinomonadaceae bacterium]
KWIVERARYLPIVSVFGMLAGAIAALFLGVVKVFELFKTVIGNFHQTEPSLFVLFETLDCFLVATALIVVAVSLYELFISGLEVPDWMLVKDLTELKAKFTFVIIPVMAVKFVQKILKYEDAVDTLYYGAAIALVAAALTAFNLVSIKEKEAKKIEKELEDESETRAEDLKK